MSVGEVEEENSGVSRRLGTRRIKLVRTEKFCKRLIRNTVDQYMTIYKPHSMSHSDFRSWLADTLEEFLVRHKPNDFVRCDDDDCYYSMFPGKADGSLFSYHVPMLNQSDKYGPIVI